MVEFAPKFDRPPGGDGSGTSPDGVGQALAARGRRRRRRRSPGASTPCRSGWPQDPASLGGIASPRFRRRRAASRHSTIAGVVPARARFSTGPTRPDRTSAGVSPMKSTRTRAPSSSRDDGAGRCPPHRRLPGSARHRRPPRPRPPVQGTPTTSAGRRLTRRRRRSSRNSSPPCRGLASPPGGFLAKTGAEPGLVSLDRGATDWCQVRAHGAQRLCQKITAESRCRVSSFSRSSVPSTTRTYDV